jgi:hypothetical protein
MCQRGGCSARPFVTGRVGTSTATTIVTIPVIILTMTGIIITIMRMTMMTSIMGFASRSPEALSSSVRPAGFPAI